MVCDNLIGKRNIYAGVAKTEEQQGRRHQQWGPSSGGLVRVQLPEQYDFEVKDDGRPKSRRNMV